MRLNNEGLKDRKSWENAGYSLPEYDRETVTKATRENPFWIHFGAGNIFRAFQANVVQDLLNQGVLDRGLVVAEGYDYEIIQKMNHPHDDYSILVTLKANGTVEKTIVGSVVESLALDSDNAEQFQRLKEIFSADSLQMASFTIKDIISMVQMVSLLPWSLQIWLLVLRLPSVILEKYHLYYMQDFLQEKSRLPW